MPEIVTMNVTEARAQFSSLLNSVFRGDQRVIVEKNGIPVVALISADHLTRLERFEEASSVEFGQLLNEMRQAFADLTTEEIEAEVERIVQKDREEQRALRLAQRTT